MKELKNRKTPGNENIAAEIKKMGKKGKKRLLKIQLQFYIWQ